MPYTGSDKKALDALKPTRFVQSDNEKIKSLSKKAVGNSTDAAEAASKIEDFVSKHIQNRGLSVGYASAVEVADSKQGDCTEFAVLTAALCRAAGIPAQVVVGIAYVNEWMNIKSSFGRTPGPSLYRWQMVRTGFRFPEHRPRRLMQAHPLAVDRRPEDFFLIQHLRPVQNRQAGCYLQK
jgi:transglutaminase-like putative cysteine protease